MDKATNFALNFQQLCVGGITHAEIMKKLLTVNIDDIVRSKCTDTDIFFKDGSIARWAGNGFEILHEKIKK